jgi:lipopolysaccharide cholinephosphotransferase
MSNNIELKKLQKKILEIVIYIDKFCKDNNIKYYLMGGSALGAVRHQGFIPWDDDFDVFMTYEDYKKFINCFREKIDKKNFYLQEENTKEWPMFFTKVRMHGTTFIERDTKKRKMHKGIYIDIMCLNNVSSNIVYRYLQYIAARLITASTLGQRGYTTKSNIKKLTIFFSKIFIRDFIKKIFINFIRSLNKSTTREVGHFFGKAKFKNTCFPKEYLGEPRYIKFESIYLPVPNKVEKYLEARYGNYMKLPDSNEIVNEIHAEFVDLNRDYKEYK